MDATNILVLLSLIGAAVAGPITLKDSDKCSTNCSETSKLKYNPGTTYVYDYRVDTESSVTGAFEDSAKTTIQTTVNIEVLSPCEFVLQLENTRLFHTDGKRALKTADRLNEFRREIEGSPLRFSFQDGVVDHVCPDETSVQSLNLKRGILSAFQNSMDDLTQSQNVTETDVTGECKAEYKVFSNGYYTTDIKKVKNILSCSNRHDFMTMHQYTAYKVPSDMQNLPIMKTSHECEQSIENGGVLKSTTCKESHVYRPFANGENGGRTTITQTLTYQTYRNGVNNKDGNVKSRSTLLFDHSANHPTKEQSLKFVEQKLSEICDTTLLDVTPNTPRLFSELVVAMKGAEKQDLAHLHQKLKKKTLCPGNGRTYKFFHDALPMVNTPASVSLMTDLITSKDLNGLETTAWLTSLAFIQNPTSEMLLDAKALLDNKDIRNDAMLPVSSMINNYCKTMGTCSQDSSVLSLMLSMERNIDYYCDASGKKFELTLVTLRAIGNAGHADRAIPVLNKCLTYTSNPLEIRVAAAEAFRRMPCVSEDKDLWDTFTNKELDSELRINAYLALMRCPTEFNLGKMAAILNVEDDEQVGAFVYSHLTNLRETSDPHKQGVAEAINNLALDKEFDLSPLKHSRNFEISALLNKINTGITAESNLIWSNTAQLPRAVSGNLTIELFGQSINLLDFGGRLEGLEYLIKNIFGPYADSNNKASKIDADNVKGSIYGRVFGNEMLFMHSKTSKPLFGEKLPSWLDILIKMAEKQHVAFTQSVQFMDVCMVIPSSAGLPIHVRVNGTATVDLNMSGKMDLRKVGASPRSMDVDGEIRPSAAVEVTGTMYVDSLVTKTGIRLRNTMHTSTAMKGRIQLTRGQQLNVEIDTPQDKMEIIDARSKFFVLHNDMEQEQEMIKENRKEFKFCSNKKITKITGMEICSELSFPNASMKADSPYYPLTGPTAVSVTLFKRDSHSGYKLFAKRIENKKASIAQISFNTPGSQTDRVISMDMSLNYKKQNVEFNMATPWKQFAVNGKLINMKDLKSLSGSLVIDDTDTYAVTGEVKVTESKSKIQISPMIELRRPGADNVQVTGFISMEKPLKSFDMTMSLSGVNKHPYTVKAALINAKKEKSVQASISLDGKNEYSIKASNNLNIMSKKSAVIKCLLEVQSPKRKLATLYGSADYRQDKSLKIDSSVFMYRMLKKPAKLKVTLLKTSRRKADNYKSTLSLKSSYLSGNIVCGLARKRGFTSLTSTVDYNIPKVSRNTVRFSGKLNDRSTKAYKSYIVQSNIGIKKNPEYNSVTKIDIGHKNKLSYVGVDVKYGANIKDKTKRIYLLTSLNKKVATLKNAIINYKVKAQAPSYNINVFLDGKHQHNRKLVESSMKLAYAPEKEINAGITLKDRSTKLAKFAGKAALSWAGNQYSINSDLTQKSPKQYSHVLNFKSGSETKHSISTVYKMPKSDSHDFVTSIKLNDMRPVSISGSANLNLRNFAASGEFKKGKNVYGFNTISKISKAPSGKFGLELIHPARRITFDVKGGKSRSKYEGEVEAAWDADNDKTKKISLDGVYFHKSAKGSISFGSTINFQSPFENIETIVGSVKYGKDPSEHSVNGKLLWGLQKKQIATSLIVKRPIGMKNLQLNGMIKTPFKGIRNADIEIVHKLNSGLSTIIKGNLEKETAKLSIQGQSLNNGFKGNMNLKSTIKNAESVIVSTSQTGTDGSYTSNVEVNHNGKVYSYDLTMSHSEMMENLQINGKIKTPIRGIRNAEIDVAHKMNSGLSTVIKGNLEKETAKLSIEGQSLNNGFKGSMNLKSTIKNVESVIVSGSHTGTDGSYTSNVEVNHNGKVYAYDLTMSHSGEGWQRKTNGDLILTLKKQKIATHWDHENTDSSLRSTLSSKWNGKRLLFDFNGSHKLSDLRNINGVLKFKSPWKPVHDIELNIDHKHGSGLINSIVFLKQDANKKASSTINYNKGQNNADFDFEIASPFHEDISGKVSTNYDNYPLTTSAELKWAPQMKGTLESSLNLESWDNAGLNLKMTTPSKKLRNVVLTASNKKQDGEIVSHLNLDYGMRKNIDFESRIANDDQKKMIRFTLRSPFEQVKSLSTGLNFNGHAYNFDTNVDFELLPNIGKFDGAINWKYDNELNGKIRLDTPFPEYPYFELSTSSILKGKARQSLIQAKYHPSQVFSLDTTYSFKHPLSFDANLRSPYPEYDDIGMSFQHNMADSSIQSHGEIKYQSDKKIEGDLNADWTSDIEGSLLVKTPFRGYETSKISMRHRGQTDKFESHGEITVAEQNIAADASFKSGYTTTGTFTFTSPIPGLKHIDATLKKKGNMKNIRGGATININGDKIQTSFNNKWMKNVLKTGFNLMTPYTETVKFALDHSGPLETFTNKINLNYGRQIDIDTIASFDLRDDDMNGNGIVKYKVGKGRNTARVSFSKSGSIEDVSFTTTTGFNKDEISVSGSLRTKGGIEGSVQIKTPFDDFKNTGMTLSHSGDISDFTTSTNINYMDNKNIDGKVEFSVARNDIKLTSELTTPFKNFESTSVKVNHNINQYSGDISGTAELTTTIGGFGSGDISYSKVGHLTDLVLKGSVSAYGKDIAVWKLTNIMKNTEVHSSCSLKSAATSDIYLSFDHSGDRFSFNTKTMGKIGNNIMSTESKMKQNYDSITADSSLTYKFQDGIKNKASINLQKDGSLDNCNMELSGKFNDDEVKLSASKSGQLNDMHFTGSASYNRDSIDIDGRWKTTENIEGTLKVLTPFDNFKNIGMVVSHTGHLSDFASNFNINYMDGKTINGKVELTAYNIDNIKFVSDLTTPFENIESLHMKFNNNFNSFTSKLSGNAAIDTSIAGFGTGSIVYSKTGGLGNLDVVGNVLRNGVETAEMKIKNNLQDQELHSSFEYKSTVTPTILLTVDHNGDLTNLKTSARASVGKKNIISGEATLSQRINTIDAEGKVMYSIEEFGDNQASLSIHKEGDLNDFNVELTGKYGGKTSKLTGNFKNKDELTGDLTVNTPIEGYKNVGLSFKHSGNLDRFNCEGKIIQTDGEEFSGKVNFYRHMIRTIEAVIEVNTPITDYEFTKFEYRHEGEPDSFKCISSLQYGNSQRITYDLSATSSPKPEFTVTFKMPQRELMASGSYENTSPRYAVSGKLDAGNGRSLILDGSIDTSSDIVGVATLSTPVDGFNHVGVSFKHAPKANGINSEGSITYMDGKVISGKAEAKVSKSVSKASIELSTPFTGYEFTQYEAKLTMNRKITKATTTLVYGDNKRIVIDAYGTVRPTPEVSLTITSPFAQDIEAFASFDNSWPKYELICKLSPGNGDHFTVDGAFDAKNDISGSLKIVTPYEDFNKIGMNFIHSGNDEKFSSEGTITYMDGQEIFGKVNFYRYMWRRLDSSLELTTPFTGMENTKAEVNFEDNSNSISTTAALEYNNGKKVNGNVKMTYSPNYEVLVTLNTPFNGYDVVRAQGALDLTEPTYEAISSLSYGYNTAYSASGKLNLYSIDNIDGSVEVNTPLTGLEYTKAEYHHKADSNELEGSVSLIYDNGKKMSCDIKTTISPNFDGTVTVKTPFRGFETMQGAATFESSYKRYETSSSLNFGQGSIFSMSSELDYSLEPMKASTKISTPFKQFRNVQLDITHEGGLTNFKTTGFLSSPLTDHVNAKANLRYDALLDMSAAASLQSSLEGFDDLRAELKTSDLAGEMKSNAVVGWTSGQQITYEGIYRKQDGWSEDKMHVDMSLSTPFVAVRSVNLQMDHSAQTDSYVEKMNFELNGDSLLDFDAEYNLNDKKSAELLVRQPWPMQYTVSKSSNDGTTDAEVFVNWNRDNQDSNVRLQAIVTDKSDSYQTENGIDLSIAHASRKVGVVHKLSGTNLQLTSNGYIYWNSDDESKVSYDMQLNDNSRRRKQILDGTFKLGLPTRTLGVTGSFSENAATTITNTVFSWDADRDETKQVGVKTTVRRGDNLKGDISISMPSMKKEIKINGEVMVNNGRVILDTKTDISYSQDSRKTLTLTSKLEDISDYYNNFNYSLALGVKHPHTNVNIQMNSHIGSSDESMTMGMATNYLTSKRQRKNFALLSEINMLKKKISLQIFNPENTVEIVGDVMSEKPYKLRFMNKINGMETFRSDMTIDNVKKAFSINSFTDSDILSFSAKYPNRSAFRVDITRHTPKIDSEEALLAVRLNSSQLLHTRLHWRPEMMEELSDYVWPKALKETENAIVGFSSMNRAISEELSSKYVAITDEIDLELRPFITALNEELTIVADKMNDLSVELEEMYYRNDYYIQNMGEGILKLKEKMQRLTKEYRTIYNELISSLRVSLNEMQHFPIGAHYRDSVNEGVAWFMKNSVRSIASLNGYMTEVNQALKEYKTSMQKIKQNALDTISNATYVDYFSNNVNQVISPYISSFHLPEEYTNIIYDVPSHISSRLNKALDKSEIKFVKDGVNEVYQQGVWAYNYWKIEENLVKNAENILKTLKEIAEGELKESSHAFAMMMQSPITVWDPEHGEIQADIPLPIAVRHLDELPDITPLTNKIEKIAVTYMPDQGTWDSVVKTMSDMWPVRSNETHDNEVVQLNDLKPKRKFHKKGRSYKVRRHRQ